MAKPWKEVITSEQYIALSPDQKAAAQEQYFSQVVAANAGGGVEAAREQFFSAYPAQQETQAASIRQKAYQDLAEDMSFGEALLVGMGRGFMEIPRGLGLVERETPETQAAMEALSEAQPVATTVGEITGEVAPFIAPGLGIGAIPSLAGRIGAGATLGGLEGAILSSAKEQDVAAGAGIGATIGGGMEALFPVIGRLGRSVVQRVKGTAPKGALIDQAGRPTKELSEALEEAGMSFDDLTADAVDYLKGKTGADPLQAARAAKFSEEGIPITRGEMGQDFAQQTTEQRLLESASDPIAEQFRQFKLKQSDAIRGALEKSIDETKIPEESGRAIKEALSGRKSLLRTQKNELYKEAAESAKDAGGIPIFTGSISDAVPDQRTLRRTDRISKGAVSDVMDTLTEYGIIDPTEDAIKKGIDVEALSLENFDELRQALNQIERADTSGASSVVIGPIRDALDKEVDNLAETLIEKGFKENVITPLKKAREVTRQLKTEFSPDSTAGKLVDVKRDGVTEKVAASNVYSELTRKAQPVENVRKVVSSLRASGEKGSQALADIQATTVLDLIESSFGTASRKVDGVPVFNPVAFKKRLKTIGDDKLKAIFSDNPKLIGRLKNIDSIASDLIPPSGTMPKGSASVILDLMDKLGVMSITSKVPGGGLLLEQVKQIAESGAARKAVKEALEATPDLVKGGRIIENELPGLATALAIPVMLEDE